MYSKNTILLVSIILVCLAILYKYTIGSNIENFGYYQNFFTPNPCSVKSGNCPKSIASKLPNSSNVLFQFPVGTPKEIMTRQVANMFKSKANSAFTNVIDVKIERNGSGSSQYLNLHSEQSMRLGMTDANFESVYIILDVIKTRPSRIGVPQVNHGIRIPLEFTSNGVIAKIDKADSPKKIDYFLHYFFDPFYCEGRYEKKLEAVGKDSGNYDFVVKPDNLMDCRWENGDEKIESCKRYPHIVDVARQIAVEPDSDSRVRNYVTPAADINTCRIKEDYIKVWDGSGVPIENEHENIKLDQYINHPALYQNKLDGLYDDLFAMSRYMPSFPAGRGSSGNM
jgi:hypothetical protein